MPVARPLSRRRAAVADPAAGVGLRRVGLARVEAEVLEPAGDRVLGAVEVAGDVDALAGDPVDDHQRSIPAPSAMIASSMSTAPSARGDAVAAEPARPAARRRRRRPRRRSPGRRSLRSAPAARSGRRSARATPTSSQAIRPTSRSQSAAREDPAAARPGRSRCTRRPGSLRGARGGRGVAADRGSSLKLLASLGAIQLPAPAGEQRVHRGRAQRPARAGISSRSGWRMNGRVCGPPRPPWKEISSSKAQPSSSSGS